MAELVMHEMGWNAVSLGGNLPWNSLAAAIRQNSPRVFWVSCSHIVDEAQYLAGYQSLYEQFATDTAFVVGGFALTEHVRHQMKYSAYCDNMQHLEGFARTLIAQVKEKPEKQQD